MKLKFIEKMKQEKSNDVLAAEVEALKAEIAALKQPDAEIEPDSVQLKRSQGGKSDEQIYDLILPGVLEKLEDQFHKASQRTFQKADPNDVMSLQITKTAIMQFTSPADRGNKNLSQDVYNRIVSELRRHYHVEEKRGAPGVYVASRNLNKEEKRAARAATERLKGWRDRT